MAANIDCSGGLRADRWEGDGLGLLRFHHGIINPQAQPICNEDGSLLVAMDGEVFDTAMARQRLAARGHRFRRADDSAELVLHLFEEDGERAFRDLTGSYSILLYDARARRLLLVTDPFFSRPVYYCHMADALAFSSRFNALVACGALDGGRLDMTSVMQFFTFQHSQYASTHYEQARAMLPASVLEFHQGRLSTRKYWRLHYVPEPGDEDELADRLAQTIRRSVQARTADGLRKGVLLSGGVDARTLVAAADAPMTAYTMGDYDNREVRIARRTARAKGWRHVFLQRSASHYADILDEAIELCGGMGRYDNCHFLGQMTQPRAECDVLFVEELMDALLKGVYWERRRPIRGLRIPLPWPRTASPDDIEQQILEIDCKSTLPSRPWLLFREPWRSRYREIMYATLREQMLDADASDPHDVIAHVGGLASAGRVEAFMNLTCVRPYVEYRSLCLDRDVLALAVSIPVRYRVDGRLMKKALKRLDPRLWAIPYANTGARVDTPAWVAWACQMATELPLTALKRLRRVPSTYTNESWPDRGELLRTPAFSDIVRRTLLDPDCLSPALFDTDRLKRVFAEHVSRWRRHTHLLFCLLTFGRWFRKYGPGAL
jgi:asparagine synthetase B (glutamine-hydrolysing)